ncbi:MAG: RHS repeat-associated core domain-containing protein [Moheibacter sp.]
MLKISKNLGDYLQDWFTQGTGGPVDVIGSSFGVLENAEQGVVQVYNELGIESPTYESTPVFIPVQSFTHTGSERGIYWFHPDHLGSTSYITNVLGEVSQHMEYFAFGETFVEEHRSSNNSPYKFNGKELDEETGWYYYGARYYDPRISVWLSVDPLAEKASNWSPYRFGFQNPIKYTDPTGMWEDDYKLGDDGSITKIRDTDDEFDRVYNSDESDFVQIEKGIIKNGLTINVPQKRALGFLWVTQKASKHSAYASPHTDDLIGLHRFITDNASVEYSYQEFQNTKTGRSAGILATDYEKRSTGFGNQIAAQFLYRNPHLIMTKDRHNHPSGTRAASGFIQSPTKYEMIPYPEGEGDRMHYEQFQSLFPGRIPANFDIIIPNSSDRVIYNADTMRVIKVSVGELELNGVN